MVIQLAEIKPRNSLLSLLIQIPKLLQSNILTRMFPPFLEVVYLHPSAALT